MKSKVLVLLLIAAAALAIGGAVTNSPSAKPFPAGSSKILYYTCPMHPSVRADKPGACPICGMNLVPVYSSEKGTNTPAVAVAPPSCCAIPSPAQFKP